MGPQAEAAAHALENGEILLLENTRFEPGETKNDPRLAADLARLGTVFVNDAFGSAHRAHASTVGVAQHLPAVAGFLMEKELTYLGKVMQVSQRPFVAILGGAKISDKIGVVENLLQRADRLLVGGGMGNTFLAARGLAMGESPVDPEGIEVAGRLLASAGDRLSLPDDVVVAEEFEGRAAHRVVEAAEIPEGWRAMDIGPKTVSRFTHELAAARLVVWNGPMGSLRDAVFRRRDVCRRPRPGGEFGHHHRRRRRLGRRRGPGGRERGGSRMFPPAAEPPSSCWKASRCQASRPFKIVSSETDGRAGVPKAAFLSDPHA